MNKLVKIISTVAVTLITLTTLSACASSTTKTLDKDTLVVSMNLQYPPFETTDASGKPTGFSVDFANALGAYLGKKIEIRSSEIDALIPELNSGKSDMIISSLAITEQRQKAVIFSNSYAKPYQIALLNKNASIQKRDDLNNENVTLAIVQGSASANWTDQYAPKAKQKTFRKANDAILDVKNGQSTAFIYDALTVLEYHEQYPNDTKVLKESLGGVSGWGVAMRKNDTELQTKVNEFIAKAQTDGTLDKIKNKYLKNEIDLFKKNDLPFIIE